MYYLYWYTFSLLVLRSDEGAEKIPTQILWSWNFQQAIKKLLKSLQVDIL